MKIALLTKYGTLAASTRQRFEQYRPYLQKVGFEAELRPLLDDEYLQQLYTHERRNLMDVAKRYVNRLSWLLSSPNIDAIWLHCELFPFLPGLFERLVRVPKKPIIFDYDDAIFHNYDLHDIQMVRRLLGPKLSTTLRGANVAFCGNAYLETYARQFCLHTEIVPTIVDTDFYSPNPTSNCNKTCPRVGWIGTPSTWTQYVAPMLPVLVSSVQNNGGSLFAMGAEKQAFESSNVSLSTWSEDAEVPFIRSLDIGIMPLADTPWARGKCGYKLIQYMSCGLPVVASPVGVNKDLVEHGVNGFLAETTEDWSSAISRLLTDADLRRRMGVAARRKVEANYSLNTWGPRVASIIADTVKKINQ